MSVPWPRVRSMTDTAAPILDPAADLAPQPRRPALSPSRASDFKTCPLLYRFRAIDRLPEAPSPAAARGTVVHAVLEQLYDLPSGGRTLAAATNLVEPAWQHLLAEEPALGTLFADDKTGTIPREAFEAKALFQMKFYALVLWRTRGVVPRQLKLIYLADRDTLTYSPDADELVRFERTLKAIWAAIARATEKGDF